MILNNNESVVLKQIKNILIFFKSFLKKIYQLFVCKITKKKNIILGKKNNIDRYFCNTRLLFKRSLF